MLQLRSYQIDLIERARAEMRAGVRRICLQGSTGSGKTVLAAQMLAQAAARGRRSWFICHRKEILEQTVETFVQSADLHVGIIAAGYPSDMNAPVQVCSVGTLTKRAARLTAPSLVLWDEAHHIAARSWSAIHALLPDAVHIGLTATPSRLDGRGLRPYFDRLLTGPTTAELIAQGYLSPYRLFAPSTVDMQGVHKTGGDYNKAETDQVMRPSTVVGDAVSTYLRHVPAGRALVFAWSLEASRGLAEAFMMAGVPAVHVDGETAPAARQAAMRAFREGSVKVLTNVDLFGEGLDVPAVDAVFLLRPTASLGLYLQQVGRGLRTSEGKPNVTVFDHVGNYARHGLPDDARAWTLDGVEKAPKTAAAALKRCARCFGVAGAGARACPYCHAVYPVKARKVHRRAGELGEMDLTQLRGQVRTLEQGCRTLQDFHRLAKRLGYAPGWAFHRWQHVNRWRHHAGHLERF